ncbi:nose resistant to fluoxetine protein 6-like [Plodia interpunctella]|uniref:nose resistant to fluoxetine protein 6-like n=1 Tax=Plodia interpunctella TaxID=58824 RepID=UPI002368BC5F|nr:nose resistant to fluoxetine protein 6-like [Plodia interpunctella]
MQAHSRQIFGSVHFRAGKMLRAAVLSVLLSVAWGSVVQINETTFASLPPLYALDEWAQCQNPGDVYCIVDAQLRSDSPSPTLRLLEAYSQQTLKHYNRTLVHRGVCVSRCMEVHGSGDKHTAAQHCVNNSVVKYGLQAVVTSVSWCSTQGSPPATDASSARALAVLCVVLVALAFLGTVLHVVGDRWAKLDSNRYLLAFSLKRNWSILTYDRSKPRSDDRMKDLTAIEGIRVIGMQCVIFSHVLFINIYSFTDNPQYIENMYDQFGWQAVMNSPLWLQAFFSMSGFLSAYVILITAETKPMTVMKCIMSVINRYVRMTPVAGVALWFTMSWFPGLGAGPAWSWLVTREARDCAQRWWYHLLYLHNHLPMGKFCMGHTWYLAADLQLYVIGLIVMLFLVRFQKVAAPVLGGLIAASALAAGIVSYFYDIKPIVTGQSPETLRTMFAGNLTLTMLYLPSWMNLSGYMGGVGCAFLLHHAQTRGLKLNQNKWFNLLFHLSITLGSIVVLVGAVFLSDSAPPRWASAVYAALDRTVVALCFNVFLLGCFSHCKSGLRSILEWRGFHTLGRLSYCVFIIHFMILRLTLAGNTQLGHISIYSMISLLITVSVLSYLIAVPVCLLVELPAIELWKALTTPERPSPAPTPTPRPSLPVLPALKPMDLLSHIRRRSDV